MDGTLHLYTHKVIVLQVSKRNSLRGLRWKNLLNILISGHFWDTMLLLVALVIFDVSFGLI